MWSTRATKQHEFGRGVRKRKNTNVSVPAFVPLLLLTTHLAAWDGAGHVPGGDLPCVEMPTWNGHGTKGAKHLCLLPKLHAALH